jgi:hypothetical protein
MGRVTLAGVIRTFTTPLRQVERARGNRRVALLGAYGLVVATVGLVVCRQGSLRGLPDIGDPFDVAGFVGRNEFGYDDSFEAYARALEVLDDRELIALSQDIQAARKADWAVVSPALRSWLDRNREAMKHWQEGAERSSGTPPWIGAEDFRDGIDQVDRLASFNFLALLEAARLEGEGDMAGAWTWYRALMRSGLHLQRRGGKFERLRGMDSVHFAREEAGEWATDPRVDAGLLRRAIADIQEVEAIAVPNSETYKADYVRLMRTLDEPWRLKRSVRRQDPMTRYPGWQDAEAQWYRYLPGYLEARWWLLREPERSRRAARIAYANWLAHCDGLRSFRPPEARRFPGLFVTDPRSMDMAFAYPAELHGWIESSLLWEVGFQQPSVRDNWRERERGKLATLLVTLAGEAYRREHDGRDPPTLESLVGSYLDRLPEGYVAEAFVDGERISQGEDQRGDER